MRLLTTLFTGMVLTACGGGSSSNMNVAPQLSAIMATTISANEASAPIDFSVMDQRADLVQITFESSNQAVVPDAGLSVSGSGVNRQLVIRPTDDTLGTTQITVYATDSGGLIAQTQFAVTVAAQSQVSFRQYSRTVFNDPETARPRDVNSRVFTNDAMADDYSDLLN